MTGLLGVVLVDRPFASKFRLTFWDLPMLCWCVVPVFSAIANTQGLVVGLRGAVYLALAWGVPYILGRIYFVDTKAQRLAARAFVMAGLAYVPICLLEVITGPQIYAALYGYEPYRWIGAHRYFGFRPIGLLEDGNQLGIWMATSALIAFGLWKLRASDRIVGIPIGAATGILLGTTLLCQSGGSILLLLGLIPVLVVSHRRMLRVVTLLLLLGIVGFACLRLGNVISLHKFVAHNTVADSVASLLRKAGRGSFGWRLSQDERYVDVALDTPVLGSGQWDWWKGGSNRPWGLWMLAFGMYGAFGLLALESLQLLPVARVLSFSKARTSMDAHNLQRVFAAAILLSAIDSLLNSAVILPLLLLVGCLSATRLTTDELSSNENPRTQSNMLVTAGGR